MIIPHVAREDLHLVAEAPEGSAMEDAVAIALKRPAIRVRWFVVFATCRLMTEKCVRRENRRLAFIHRCETWPGWLVGHGDSGCS